jgi:anti-anti-sigma factor
MQHNTDTLHPTPSPSLNRPGDLTFTIDRRDHEARLAVTGAIDISTQDSLSRAVAAILQPPIRALLLDLDGVSFFGAAGVTALINIRNAAAEAQIRVVLTGVHPHVRHILDLTRTAGIIPIAHPRTIGATTADSLNTNFSTGTVDLVPAMFP